MVGTGIFNKSAAGVDSGRWMTLQVSGSEKASFGAQIFNSSTWSGAFGILTQGIIEIGIGDSIKVVLNTAGDWRPGSDNTVNLGTATSGRWKDVFAVTKTSVLDVPWTKSKTVLIGVVEGPEYRVQDQGTIRLGADGEATVQLDQKFVAIVNLRVPWQVTTSGAKVTVKSALGWFMLEGDAGAEVDWHVSAVRAGFENVRWRDPGIDPEPRGLRDPLRAIEDKDPRNNTESEKS